MPLIKIDDRESNENLVLALRQEKNTVIKICRLPIGDYQVENHLIVERKTIADLTFSIKDGRFFQQAAKLSSLPIQGIVILEGSSIDYRSVKMKREAIQGALVTLSLLFRIPLLRSKSPEETTKLILYAARQIQYYGTHPRPIRHSPVSGRMDNKYKTASTYTAGLSGNRAYPCKVAFGKIRYFKICI